MKDRIKILIILFIILVVAVGGQKYYTTKEKAQSDTAQKKDIQEDSSVLEPQKSISLGTNVSPNTQNQNEVKKISLKSVNNAISGSGQLMQSFDGQFYTNLVQATLPDPQNGTYYEAWLVKTGAKNDYYSLGYLQKEGDNYTVTSTSKVNHPDYLTVIVTLQTESSIEGNPDQTILKGSF